jgi:poly(3-hydroxybutyrate) depolymerase
MSGTSAGGMMVDLLLCKSPFIQRTITAAANILGGIGQDFSSQCQPSKQVPLALIHGENDAVIGFSNPSNVDGSQFLSTGGGLQNAGVGGRVGDGMGWCCSIACAHSCDMHAMASEVQHGAAAAAAAAAAATASIARCVQGATVTWKVSWQPSLRTIQQTL